ncbi:MAG: RIP metalloprotease RseP [Treponema sp.]|jgi:regulator of sigma E protease|nr:RIP metalloprotease RseP [Treponema sp.]
MSIVINIALGLIGLGVVVFFHELGHFLAARLVKINVEAFSIGWGNPVLKKKIGSVEYRIGMFPVGGYCKMQGETNYSEAWENMRDGKTAEKGSYLAASPWRRIVVSAGGPLFNLVLAVILLSVIWGAGFEINTVGNKIILASEISNTETFPADIAGIKTGDLIKSINGQEITYYHEIQEIVALNPNKNIVITVERDGQEQSMNVTPFLDKATGAGRVGIYSWIDAVIDTVAEDSPAQRAGLRTGDRIISANGIAVHNSEDFRAIRIQNVGTLLIEYERGGQRGEALFSAAEAEGELGFSWEIIRYRTPNLSFPAAIAKGIRESYRTLAVSVTSLRLLFMGIDLTQAVSGPVRITYMMGDVATQGFEQGVGTGLRSIANFIALISIALCVMNMLPLPMLDGGMIILFLVEMIRRKPIPPKAISVFNACGMAIILCLMVLALFGDIMFFVRS